MVMAGSGVLEADATQEDAPSADDIQQQGYSQEELESIIGRVVSGHLTGMQRQLDQRLTNLEQLRPQFEAVLGTSRRAEAMIQRIFKGNQTEEDVEEFERSWANQEAAEKAERTATENQALRDILSKQDGGEAAAWDTLVTLVLEAAVDEGLDEETVARLKPKTRTAGPDDQFGLKGLYRDWRKALRTEALSRQRESEPVATIVTERSNGAASTLQSLVNRMADPNEHLTPDEMYQAIQAYNGGKGILPNRSR